ncbi:hypothetical protein MTO96_022416 [Rhipicephalus appendiculatus]
MIPQVEPSCRVAFGPQEGKEVHGKILASQKCPAELDTPLRLWHPEQSLSSASTEEILGVSFRQPCRRQIPKWLNGGRAFVELRCLCLSSVARCIAGRSQTMIPQVEPSCRVAFGPQEGKEVHGKILASQKCPAELDTAEAVASRAIAVICIN